MIVTAGFFPICCDFRFRAKFSNLYLAPSSMITNQIAWMLDKSAKAEKFNQGATRPSQFVDAAAIHDKKYRPDKRLRDLRL